MPSHDDPPRTAEYAEPAYAAPPLLRRMTAAGLLGRKTGRGFYDYQEGR